MLPIMRFIRRGRAPRLLFCLGLLITATAQARSGSDDGGTKIGGTAAGLDKASAKSFIQAALTRIAKRDERIFSMVTDGSRVLTPDFTRRVLGYRTKIDRRNARKWRRLFPGYSRIPLRYIKHIKITESHGPLRADVRVMTGGTEKNIQWKTVPASFVLLKVKIPRRGRALSCKIYKVQGKLYWEPFGW